MGAGVAGMRALVVDYGGVLTSSLVDSMGGWVAADGIDGAAFAELMRDWLGPRGLDENGVNPVHQLETGAITGPEFEAALAAKLSTVDGRPLVSAGLLERMFAGFAAEPVMVGVVRRARAAGFATALLSNSWANTYPPGLAELFDEMVISGEVGMRKPDAEIYELTASRLGLPAGACVFVDDLAPNVRGAVAVGMIGVHHTDPATTVDELEAILGVPLH